MVPVASLQANGGESTPGRSESRRLPPVETGGPAVAEAESNFADSGMAYPTTSTP
jgi:hypothetical protein